MPLQLLIFCSFINYFLDIIIAILPLQLGWKLLEGHLSILLLNKLWFYFYGNKLLFYFKIKFLLQDTLTFLYI